MPSEEPRIDSATDSHTEGLSSDSSQILGINVPENKDDSVPKIGFIGVGGAGCNSINNLMEEKDLKDVSFVACNTDRKSVDGCKAATKIYLGQTVQGGRNGLGGLGAGKNPLVGFEAARMSLTEIIEAIAPLDMVFIGAGMGGGTGTGAAGLVAKTAKEMGKLVVAIVSRPFHVERKYTLNLAQEGIHALSEHVNAIMVLDNQQLESICRPDCSERELFKMYDDVIATAIRTIIDIISCKGGINTDYNDICNVLQSGGYATITTGYATGQDKIDEVMKEVVTNRLLDRNIDLKYAHSVLMVVTSGPKQPFGERQSLLASIPRNLGIDGDAASIKFGTNAREDFEDAIRVSVIAAGVSIDHIDKYKPECELVNALREIKIPIKEEDKKTDLFQEIIAKKPLPSAEEIRAMPYPPGYRSSDDSEKDENFEQKVIPITGNQEQSTFADKQMREIPQDTREVNQRVEQYFLSESTGELSVQSQNQPPPVQPLAQQPDEPSVQSQNQPPPVQPLAQQPDEPSVQSQNQPLPVQPLAQQPSFQPSLVQPPTAPVQDRANIAALPSSMFHQNSDEQLPGATSTPEQSTEGSVGFVPQRPFIAEEERSLKERLSGLFSGNRSQHAKTSHHTEVRKHESTPKPVEHHTDQNPQVRNDEWLDPPLVDYPQSLQRNMQQSERASSGSNRESNYDDPSISVMKKQAQ